MGRSPAYVFKFLTMFHLFAGVLIPFFTVWGKISFAQVMLLQAIFTASVFVLEVPTGAIADRFGRKTSLIFGAVALAIGVAVYSIYPNFWVFAIGEVIWACGFALVSGADQALVYDSLKELGEEEKSKKIFGRWESLGVIAIAIAAPIGSLIAEYVGLRYTMIGMSVPFFIATSIAMTFKEPQVGRPAQRAKYFQSIVDGSKYLKSHKALRILAFD